MTDQDQPAPTTETRREEWVVQQRRKWKGATPPKWSKWQEVQSHETDERAQEHVVFLDEHWRATKYVAEHRIAHRVTTVTETVVTPAPDRKEQGDE